VGSDSPTGGEDDRAGDASAKAKFGTKEAPNPSADVGETRHGCSV
jgi:hypothetical protein